MMLLLIAVLCSVPVLADSTVVSPLQAADAAYAKRSDLHEATIALQGYSEIVTSDYANAEKAEAFWKASRVAWWLGDHDEDRSVKLRYFQAGIEWAKAGLALNHDSVESHFWLAANYGSFGETKGILKSLSMVKPIRQEMAEVIRLDDHYLGGGGYRVLGVVDYKVPGIVGGNKKRALEELNKALAIAPNEPFTHYYLAEYYKVIGDKVNSQEHVKILQGLTVPADSQPELEMLQAKAKKNF